jgi:hypothetical protein
MLIRIVFVLMLLASATKLWGQEKINVLFLGNSLTYYNNLPELVKQLAEGDGVKMTYQSIALPNYALVDHWSDGKAQREIQSGKFNYVIVQQGPSSQQEGRTYLLEYGLKFDSLCDKHNAKLAVYMVWPAKARAGDFDGVYASYLQLATSANALFCPAGEAWRQVWKNYPAFSLYGVDNFHPEYKGSVLAALVLYGSIMEKHSFEFVKLSQFDAENLSKSELNILIRAAERTLAGQKQ